MAAGILRRTVATAGLAVLATIASPLAGLALAADPAVTAGTFHPANGDTVTENRPLISVDYNTPLNTSSSTITVTDTSASNAAIPCARAFTTDHKTIGCTLSSDLTDAHTYKVTIHAVNADSSSHLDESASWTIDIPSPKGASPSDGSTVAVAQTVKVTYDEQIDATHSTASLVNGTGNNVPGTVSVVTTSKEPPTGQCPFQACVLQFTAGQTLAAGTYTATFHADGVNATNPASPTDNPDAFANTVVHFTVNKVVPDIGPQNVTAPANITQANVGKVPFSGWAQPGFNVGVAIYDEACDQSNSCDPFGPDTEGTGAEDGFGHTTVTDCADSDAMTVGGFRLCPFTVTVDDSNGCDTGNSEFQCNGGDPTTDVVNQWYAYSYSGAGQKPAHACPTTGGGCPTADPAINRDTTAPAAPDSSAHGFLTNNSPTAGNASVTVSATDLTDSPDGYVVRVADQFGDQKDYGPFTPDGMGNLSKTFTVAPGDGIYDGAETVSVATSDTLGNTSDFVTVNADPNKSFNKEVLQLAAADPANGTDSLVGANGQIYDFAALGPDVKVGVPQSITMHFNEPIRTAVTNNSSLGSAPGGAHLCLLDSQLTCVNFFSASGNLSGNTLQNPDTDRTMLTWTAPSDFASSLSDGIYSVAAYAPAANCPDRPANSPPAAYSCETSGGLENDPGTWQTLTTFRIDKEAPVIQTLSVSPTTIGPSKAKAVFIKGTSDPDTRSVQIAIKSSAGGTTQILSTPVPAPVDPSATSVAWSFFPVDLSHMRDGKITISAQAIDDAGNQTPKPGKQITATLKAHVSKLTETATRTITYGHAALVSGKLVDQAGHAISGAKITIRPRYTSNGHYLTAQTATTDSHGHWGRLFAPIHNVRFYASYAGSTTGTLHDAASTNTALTAVRVAIAFTSPRNGSTVGSPVTLHGKVLPSKAGQYVYIYRHTSSGNHLLGRARLSSTSTFSFRIALPHGTSTLFAKIGNTIGNLGNRTAYLKLTD